MPRTYPENLRKEIIDVIEDWNRTGHIKEVSVTDSKLMEGEYDIAVSIKMKISFEGIPILIEKTGKTINEYKMEDVFRTYTQNSEFDAYLNDVYRLKEFLKDIDDNFYRELDRSIKYLYWEANL